MSTPVVIMAVKDDYYLKSWNTKDDGVYNAKTETHTGSDDQTTAATRCM